MIYGIEIALCDTEAMDCDMEILELQYWFAMLKIAICGIEVQFCDTKTMT